MLTPSPVPSLRTLAELFAGTGKFAVRRDLLNGRPRDLTPADLDRWEAENLERLAAWEARWPSAVAGETLCHFDPRADNYLIDGSGRAWVVDWSRACVGAKWVDLVTFAVTLAGDGYDVGAMLADGPVLSDVDPDDVNAHLSVLAGYWRNAVESSGADRRSGVLEYQRRSAAGALAWLRDRTGG